MFIIRKQGTIALRKVPLGNSHLVVSERDLLGVTDESEEEQNRKAYVVSGGIP